jgi:DNA-binding NtrC family response regulator
MIRVLVVDDDPAMREVLTIRLEKWGYEVRTAGDSDAARRVVEEWDPSIVVSDMVMPGQSGLDLLKSLKAGDKTRPVVLITAHGELDAAVEAMKHGAEDYITKPIDYAEFKAVLEEISDRVLLRVRTLAIQSRVSRGGDFGPFIGRSRPMRQLYEMIEQVAHTDASVLITGPSGTGKELVAQTIHEHSARSQGPFLPVNTAAIPSELMESEIFGHEKGAFTGAVNARPGCFELAHGGTLFLDEIGDMPVKLQAKLLRVLEDGRVRRLGGREEVQFDVRVLAATNREPQKAIADGDLREDLLFRLNVFNIDLPPLKERKSDVPYLSQFFISILNARHSTRVEGVDGEALALLEAYLWPGNVRELRNVIERATVLAKQGWIGARHLPHNLKHAGEREDMQLLIKAGTPLAEVEMQLILKTLELTGDNKAEAARRLGVDVKTIRNKLKDYGL